jgi:hypothetical protein
VKAQNRVRRRKGKPKRASGNRADTIGISATPIKVWDILKRFHPYKDEILSVVKILNSIGANCIIIAATLNLQKFKTIYGEGEWTEDEVKGLLAGYRA